MKTRYEWTDEEGRPQQASRWFPPVGYLVVRDHEILRLAEELEKADAKILRLEAERDAQEKRQNALWGEVVALREVSACYRGACEREETSEKQARAAEADRLKIENEGLRGDVRRLREAAAARERTSDLARLVDAQRGGEVAAAEALARVEGFAAGYDRGALSVAPERDRWQARAEEAEEKARQLSCLTPNEIRAREGLPPLPEAPHGLREAVAELRGRRAGFVDGYAAAVMAANARLRVLASKLINEPIPDCPDTPEPEEEAADAKDR